MSVWCLSGGGERLSMFPAAVSWAGNKGTSSLNCGQTLHQYIFIQCTIYCVLILYMYFLCFKSCHLINFIKANFRTSRFDGGKNRGWLFNEYGDPILVRSVSPCWLQESNVSLLLWPSSISTWGDVIDLALEKALKKHILSEDVDASKRYWLRRGSGGNIQGYNSSISSSIHCYC